MKTNQNKPGHNADKALSKAAEVKPKKTGHSKEESPETDFPLSEKDEVKQAEERQRKRATKK
ncbi:hypothetical protein DBR11_19720 [Pedobacter sp. HMWF019]|uniref:hypothetical protein n=1 Tax=Pedobacter sp. HMWF019 TaxID=2056856 RepID=UPI000D3A2205|nr:hypothetical protein [Pedobacter sp. HMWF019]PTS96143.1 hypothetical protein DBR11_19720 [Pedobacter sp. HMWF019]